MASHPAPDPSRITAADLARHRAAIGRIRRKLFHRYAPADYSIVAGSEEIIAPIASFSVQIWNDNAIERHVALGGLRYEFNTPRKGVRRWFEVRHVKGSAFRFFGIWTDRPQDEGRRFIRFALDAHFGDIDEVVYRCIRQMQAEDARFAK